MSAHETPAPSRERVLAAIDKPIPAIYKQAFLAMFVAGFAVLVYGMIRGNGRAWQAFHVNWLFFTTISSAAVMFVAVQRPGLQRPSSRREPRRTRQTSLPSPKSNRRFPLRSCWKWFPAYLLSKRPLLLS